uniref:Putative secreted protein n=1 Tax=Anopheles marajoara TaxID=58244 RepID=A0A2M4C9B4_9DIPT
MMMMMMMASSACSWPVVWCTAAEQNWISFSLLHVRLECCMWCCMPPATIISAPICVLMAITTGRPAEQYDGRLDAFLVHRLTRRDGVEDDTAKVVD